MSGEPTPTCSYEINPRLAHLGGGWRLRLLEDGTEVGGGVFPADADADPRAGMDWWNSLDEHECRHWLQEAGNTGRAVDAWTAYLTATAHEDALTEATNWLASRGDGDA